MKKKPTHLVLRNRAYGLKWRKAHRDEERERARKWREDQIHLRKRDAIFGKKAVPEMGGAAWKAS